MNSLRKNDADFFTGTSQQERRLRALMPEHLRIDDREIQDLLNDVYAAADQILFAGAENTQNTHWSAFFDKSPAFLLASILSNRPGDWAERMREILQGFYEAGEGKGDKACNQAIQVIREMFLLIDAWYVRSEAMKKWKEKTPLNKMLEQAVRTDLQAAFQRFSGLIAAMDKEGLLEAYQEAKLSPIWMENSKPEATFQFTAEDRHTRFQFIMEESRQLHQRLLFIMNLVEKKAAHWFEEALQHQQDHDPHIGLLLAFLQLFLHARDQLNAKPREHLHYYFFEVLKQALRPHTPDRTIVCFRLSDHIEEHLIEKGASLLADVNALGIPSTYAAVEDLWVSRVEVAALSSVHLAKNNMIKTGSSYKLVTGIYVAPVANSQDGLGKAFQSEDQSWPPFGEEQLDKTASERRMIDARIGFIVASPVLCLQEGERSIHLRFEFAQAAMARFFDLIEDIAHNTAKKPEDVAAQLFHHALLIDSTTETGWFRLDRWQVDSLAEWKNNNGITLSAYLSIDDPPVAACAPDILGASYNTAWPLIRVCLNADAGVYLYSFLQSLELEKLVIDVEVSGMKRLQMSSDLGPLDSAAPFMPFGPIPEKGANLLIGNAELFKKRLTELSFHLEWNKIPDEDGGFANYYRAYGRDITNDSFKVRLSALSSYAFRPSEPTAQQVFPLFAAESPEGRLSQKTVIEGIQLDSLRLHPDYSLSTLSPYSNTARTGYFKLQLADPAGGFGHSEYQRLFTAYLLAQTASGKKTTTPPEAPAEPFVPVLNHVSIHYKASSRLNLRPLAARENDAAADEKIIALYPFGYQEVFAAGKGLSSWLFPRFEEDGYLYIGLKEVTGGKPLTLYFQMQESKIRYKPLNVKVTGCYLHGDDWVPFTEEQTLSNTTRGFATSGIVSLILPEFVDLEHTLMPSGLFWIRVAAKGNLDPIGRLIAVYPHAVEAVWEGQGDDRHFEPGRTLPRIKELLQPRMEIANVLQPGPFYGGSPKEDLKSFYVRTGERLRHKNRGVLSWDIEHLILQQFPFVRRAKCVTTMQSDEVPAGKIKVVVIPNAPETDLTPMLGFYQLRLIAQFLESKLSPFVKLEVTNPVYEKIKVTCAILLEKGLEHERGKYLQTLHEDLKDFICPWLKAGNIKMGSGISKNEVLDFINGRPYVRFVTGFSMVHIYDVDEQYTLADTADGRKAHEILYANTPWSILIPVDMHQIEILSRENYVLPDMAAIEEMRLGTDFIIMPDENVQQPEMPDNEEDTGLDGRSDDTDESFLLPTY